MKRGRLLSAAFGAVLVVGGVVIVLLDRLSQRERFTGRDDLVFPGDTGGPVDASSLRRRFVAAALIEAPEEQAGEDAPLSSVGS